VRRQAPRRVGLEHVVLQDVVAGVRPVVGDLSPVVVAHDVGPLLMQAVGGTERVVRAAADTEQAGALLADEAVHPAVVDVSDGIDMVVRAAAVPVLRVVERPDATVRGRIRQANRRDTVAHRDSVGARIRTKVRVEGTVLLHDHDDVPDLVDAGNARSRRAMRSLRLSDGRASDRDEDER
jgi:hypothetical protein